MASWCCPQVSSEAGGGVQPSIDVLTSYGRMAAAARRRTMRVPGVHECCLPSAKTESEATRARPFWRSFRSGDVSRRVLGSILVPARRVLTTSQPGEETRHSLPTARPGIGCTHP